MCSTRRSVLGAGVAGLAGCVKPAATDETTHIGLVGDVMLGRSVNERWKDSPPEGVWGSTLARLRELDGWLLNLECVISDRGNKWPDKTYYFRADPGFAVPALRVGNASVVTLANNHSLDFGATALAETRSYLENAGVSYTGAGPDRTAAFQPAVTDIGGVTVATIGLTDRYGEYAATETEPGTAHVTLDPAVFEARQSVRQALASAERHNPDLVVVSLHWGPNWTTAPEDSQQAFAHWLIEQGVDIVHGHSAHVLQGIEVYRGHPIIYDAGDFVDDYIHKEDYYNKRSALFELVIAEGSLSTLRVIPTEIDDTAATMASATATEWVQTILQERSAPFETTIERTSAGLSIPLDQ